MIAYFPFFTFNDFSFFSLKNLFFFYFIRCVLIEVTVFFLSFLFYKYVWFFYSPGFFLFFFFFFFFFFFYEKFLLIFLQSVSAPYNSSVDLFSFFYFFFLFFFLFFLSFLDFFYQLPVSLLSSLFSRLVMPVFRNFDCSSVFFFS